MVYTTEYIENLIAYNDKMLERARQDVSDLMDKRHALVCELLDFNKYGNEGR